MKSCAIRTESVGHASGASRGQVSLESLLIVSFLFLLLIPILVYVLSTMSSESWKMDSAQASVAARRIASIANRLALGGDGTFSVESVFIPSSVERVSVNGREITFTLDAKEFGLIDESAVSDVPLVLDPASNWTNIRGMNLIMMNVTGGRVMLTK